MTIDFDTFEVLTFDCYGTLIDWETGILRAFDPILDGPDRPEDETLLAAYAEHEAALEAEPYLPYREVLARAATATAAEFGVAVADDQRATFGGSVPDWPAFEDSAAALAALAGRFRLVALTNCDDDLFAASNERLGQPFSAPRGGAITAEAVRAYKPARAHFDRALDTLGVPPERILHVAQSLFHDHVTAQALGWTSVWVNRRGDRPGSGATKPAEVTADAEVRSMAELAQLAGVTGPR